MIYLMGYFFSGEDMSTCTLFQLQFINYIGHTKFLSYLKSKIVKCTMHSNLVQNSSSGVSSLLIISNILKPILHKIFANINHTSEDLSVFYEYSEITRPDIDE